MGNNTPKYEKLDNIEINNESTELFKMIDNYPETSFEEIKNYVTKYPEILNELYYYNNWYRSPIDNKHLENWRVPPIFIAIKKSSFKLVKLFIDLGANVNIKAEPHNHTPLMCSAIFGASITIVKLLVHSGANINDVTTTGISTIILSALHSNKYNSQCIFEYLIDFRNTKVDNRLLDMMMKMSRDTNADINLNVINILLKKGYICHDNTTYLKILALQNANIIYNMHNNNPHFLLKN